MKIVDNFDQAIADKHSDHMMAGFDPDSHYILLLKLPDTKMHWAMRPVLVDGPDGLMVGAKLRLAYDDFYVDGGKSLEGMSPEDQTERATTLLQTCKTQLPWLELNAVRVKLAFGDLTTTGETPNTNHLAKSLISTFETMTKEHVADKMGLYLTLGAVYTNMFRKLNKLNEGE